MHYVFAECQPSSVRKWLVSSLPFPCMMTQRFLMEDGSSGAQEQASAAGPQNRLTGTKTVSLSLFSDSAREYAQITRYHCITVNGKLFAFNAAFADTGDTVISPGPPPSPPGKAHGRDARSSPPPRSAGQWTRGRSSTASVLWRPWVRGWEQASDGNSALN